MPLDRQLMRVDEIVEAGIGGDAYLALHISEMQASAAQLGDELDGRPGISAEFVELLFQVAGYEVRL